MSKKELEEQFDQYGVTFNDAILEKCVELCLEYNVQDAGEFVENWMAYTINKLNGADPTTITLADMARQEYDKAKENKRTNARQSNKMETDNGDDMLKVYRIEGGDDDDDVDDGIMDAYFEPTSPKRKVAKPAVLKTPKTSKALFTPASYSPLPSTDSRPVNDESGNVLCTFGRAKLVKECQWTQHRNGNVNIQLSDIGNGKYISAGTRYMIDSLPMRATLEYEELYKLGRDICERLKSIEKPSSVDSQDNDEIEEIFANTKIDTPCLQQMECIGRIIIETEKITRYNIYLVGLDPDELHSVQLDLSKCKNYSLYPGQVVLVRGLNLRGDCIVVDRIVSATNITHTPTPKITSLPLSLVIASGPYTANDDLAFQPLQDLVKYCKDNIPDVLIMTGPFLNTKGTALINMADRFDQHFDRMIDQLVRSLSPHTHILIVSSHEDANSSFVYPTHPYESKQQYRNLHLLPDPCVVDIEGIHVGITSTDTINMMSNNELSINEGTDPIKRSIFHMFFKKTFYPLRPASIPLDVGLAQKYAKLNALPNLLILPSDAREFIRDYNNCLCINPGRLSVEQGTGMFARIVLHPTESQTTKFFNYVAGQVVKI